MSARKTCSICCADSRGGDPSRGPGATRCRSLSTARRDPHARGSRGGAPRCGYGVSLQRPRAIIPWCPGAGAVGEGGAQAPVGDRVRVPRHLSNEQAWDRRLDLGLLQCPDRAGDISNVAQEISASMESLRARAASRGAYFHPTRPTAPPSRLCQHVRQPRSIVARERARRPRRAPGTASRRSSTGAATLSDKKVSKASCTD